MVLFSDPLIRNATSGNDFDLRNLKKEKISIYLNIPDADKERLKTIRKRTIKYSLFRLK